MVTPFILSQAQQLSERIFQTAIPGLYFIKHELHRDERGFFAEISLIPDLNQHLKVDFRIQQVNLAHSATNVARGFHAENWNKLITITRGSAFCAYADIMPTSPTYQQVVTLTLGEANPDLNGSLFISSGIANSYCVTAGPLDYLYAVDQLYRDRDSAFDRSISLFDPSLNVTWPIPKAKMLLSSRDQSAQNLT